MSRPGRRALGLPPALASLELPDEAASVDLDDPLALSAEGLRPSQVATRRRRTTQSQAAEIHASHPVAIRWWSTLEASWINWTLFDRVAAALAPGSNLRSWRPQGWGRSGVT
jgi:hypothetical protein